MGRFYKKFNVRIGIVCDTILYESFSPAADFVYIPPTSDWRDRVRNIELLLVVSTWRGLEDSDWYGVGRMGEPIRQRLLEIIAECRQRNIKTVFYSKEDPPNYNVFLDFAKACDFVFTSAVEMVPKYKADCGHDRVKVLKFCINPHHDNPIGISETLPNLSAIFSGSWMIKYPLRCRDLAAVLDGVVKAGSDLCIVDRNSYRNNHPGYRFPKRFAKFVVPAMQHSQLSELHRKHLWSINVNSVTDSSSMFAGRCYELLANGCLVVSNYSTGMLKELPEIVISDSAGFIASLMVKITKREIDILRSSGIRRVMTGNTCYDRIAEILQAVGIGAEVEVPSVAVVLPRNDEKLLDMFNAQTYVNKRLFFADSFNDAARSACKYVTYWMQDQVYGPHFIQDLINVFKYADVDFAVDEGPAYSYVDTPVPGRTLFENENGGLKGFCVKRSEASIEEIEEICQRVHEISSHPGRCAEDYKPPLLMRALACLRDNGPLYTFRRILFGKQY